MATNVINLIIEKLKTTEVDDALENAIKNALNNTTFQDVIKDLFKKVVNAQMTSGELTIKVEELMNQAFKNAIPLDAEDPNYQALVKRLSHVIISAADDAYGSLNIPEQMLSLQKKYLTVVNKFHALYNGVFKQVDIPIDITRIKDITTVEINKLDKDIFWENAHLWTMEHFEDPGVLWPLLKEEAIPVSKRMPISSNRRQRRRTTTAAVVIEKADTLLRDIKTQAKESL